MTDTSPRTGLVVSGGKKRSVGNTITERTVCDRKTRVSDRAELFGFHASQVAVTYRLRVRDRMITIKTNHHHQWIVVRCNINFLTIRCRFGENTDGLFISVRARCRPHVSHDYRRHGADRFPIPRILCRATTAIIQRTVRQ